MIKIELNEGIDYGDFNGLGTSNNPNDKRTNYRFTDKYISGNDESPDVLFRQVMNNYITDRGELETIKEILERNGWEEESKIVQYYIDEIDEEKEYGDDYSISRMKIDIADGYDHAGFEDVSWGEDFKLSCWLDADDIIIHLADWGSDSFGQGSTSISVDEFMSMTRGEFDSLVGQVNAYAMTYEDEFSED